MITRQGRDAPLDDPNEVRRRVMEMGVSVAWAYVALDNGLHFAYPGKGTYPPEYDPRLRPWYVQTRNTRGPRWLQPYFDVSGRGLVLPVTRTLHRPDGRFLGVAGVEMTLAYVREHLLKASEIENVLSVALLDGAGRVVAASTEQEQEVEVGTLINALSIFFITTLLVN